MLSIFQLTTMLLHTQGLSRKCVEGRQARSQRCCTQCETFHERRQRRCLQHRQHSWGVSTPAPLSCGCCWSSNRSWVGCNADGSGRQGWSPPPPPLSPPPYYPFEGQQAWSSCCLRFSNSRMTIPSAESCQGQLPSSYFLIAVCLSSAAHQPGFCSLIPCG